MLREAGRIASGGRGPARSSGRRWACLLLAVHALVLPVACQPDRTRSEPPLERLVRALGETRRLEGRLSGVRHYSPYPGRSAPLRLSALPVRALDAVEAITHLPKADRGVERLRLAADLDLLLGQEDVALAVLTEASARAPSSAAAWNDLAVAHLAAAAAARAPAEHLARALDAATAAAAMDPLAVEPLFNLAVAADKLDLTTTAAAAWSRAMALERSPEWREEIRVRAERLARRPVSSWIRHQTALIDSRTPLPVPALTTLATQFPQQTKELVNDTLLAAWARAWLDGRASDTALFAARVTALTEALQAIDGDTLLRRCAGVMSTLQARAAASPRAHAAARRLAEAHIAYADGRELSERNRRERAAERFADATRGFERAASPCRAWAMTQAAVTLYQSRDLDAADERLARARTIAATNRFHSLSARVHWLLGLTAMQRQRIESSLRAYTEALGAYERAREEENAVNVAGAAADALRIIGEHREGWTFLSRALTRLNQVSSQRRRYVLLLNASLYASDEALPQAAMTFQDASLEAARARGVPNTLVEGLVRRARLHLRAEARASARRDLDEAEGLLPSIESASSRSYLQAWIDRIRGESLAAADAAQGMARLDKALAQFARFEPADVPAVHLARGRLALGLQDPSAAERSFQQGVGVFAAHWGRLSTDRYRVSYLDEGWGLFDELIRLRAVTQRDPEAAFLDAERVRARGLARVMGAPMLSLAAVRQRLPRDRLLLYYVTLEDRLLIWGVTAGETRFRMLPIGRSELARLVHAYRGLIDAGQSIEAIAPLGEQLFADLVASVLPQPRPTGRWLVVPDGPLHALPFAALVDPTTRRVLAQDRLLVLLPGARFVPAIGGLPSTTTAGRPPARVLTVSVMAATDPALPLLPEASREGRDVAASYAESLLIEGADATPSRFLAAARGAFHVIHFSGHARINSSQPWASHLVLSPDRDHPHGLLTEDELARTRYDGVRLVFLAACETASGAGTRGEGLLGLARPFLASGAAVVGTLWTVEDAATRTLARTFHREYVRGGDAAEALRAARRALLASTNPADRLPRTWAAFVVIGSPSDAPRAIGSRASR